MTIDEFIVWAAGREGRWELVDGVPVGISPERLAPIDAKYRITRALETAIEKSGVSCKFAIDGLLVRIDDHRCFQPDALVYCDRDLPGDAFEISDPLVVVEVLSPSDASYDLRDKLIGYFQVASIRHYLIVDPDKRLVIHHRRTEGTDILTRLISHGTIHLDPPGIEVSLSEVIPETGT